MYPANACQATIAAIGFIIIDCVLLSSFLHGHLSTPTACRNGGHQGTFSIGNDLRDAVFNSTLGFQKLFVLNLPERTDHRDALALTGALSGMQFDFMEAVHGKDMSDKALPNGDPQRFDNKGRGSWRAHMNAIRAVVEQNLTSAVIFEDDVDWDIRIKQQLFDFSQASRALLQPLDDKRSIYADPTFPESQDPNVQTDPIYFDHLPHTRAPEISPYGDDWDVLWLGHCGMRRPVANMLDPWGTIARRIPKGHVVQENDTTAPAPRHIHVFDDPGHPGFRNDFAPHSRVVHHSMDAICSLVYAVSQQGARKILYELAVQQFDDFFDIMLRQFCDGQRWHEKHTCLTVQPTLFDHHRPPGPVPHDSDTAANGAARRNRGYTLNIRWSTRMNVDRLLRGDTEFVDSYPDN